MTKRISLSVNGSPVELDYFVEGFIDHTAGGIISALEGTGEIKVLDIAIEGDKVTVNLNSAVVPLKPFASKIIRSTVEGMVSSLKGVGKVDRVDISIKR